MVRDNNGKVQYGLIVTAAVAIISIGLNIFSLSSKRFAENRKEIFELADEKYFKKTDGTAIYTNMVQFEKKLDKIDDKLDKLLGN